MRKNEQRLRLVLEATEDGVWDWNLQTGRVYFSPSYYTMMGYDPDEFPPAYESWRQLIHPEDVGQAEKAVQCALKKLSSFAIEFRFKAKDGQWRWIMSRGKVVESDTSGNAVRVTGSHTDISERKQTEEALLASAEQYRIMTSTSMDGFAILDAPGHILDVNEAYSRMIGYSRDELLKMSVSDIETVGTADEIRKQHQKVLTGSDRFESRHRRKDGRIIDVEISMTHLPRSGQIMVYLRDITERKRAEEELRASQERLSQVIEGSNDGFWDWNVATGQAYFSDRYYTMLGYAPNEFMASYDSWRSLIHPEDLAATEDRLRQHFDEKLPAYAVELRLRTSKGDYKWILARGKVVERDAGGEVVRMSGTHTDITERKRVEEALEKRIVALTQPLDAAEGIAFEDLFNLSEIQHLQDLYAKAFGVAALITYPDGIPITKGSNFCHLCSEIIRKNPLGAKNCNYSDSIIGHGNPSGPNIQPCLSAGLSNAGVSIIVGGRHVANWLIGQIRDETLDDEKILGYARQIGADETEFLEAYLRVPAMPRKQFEQAAQVIFVLANLISTSAYQNIQQARFITDRKRAEEELRKFERIVSTSQDVLGLINRDYIYAAVNESLLKAHKKSRQEVVGHTVSEVMGESVFREKIRPRLDKAFAGQAVHYQELFDFTGLGRRIMDVNYFPMFDKQGNVEGAVLNARDITETRKLEEQLIQAQKIESIGTLAGGVAHEINNPITGIMNYAQLILDRTEGQNPIAEFAGEILHETERVANIVRNLLTFARQEKQTHSPNRFSDIFSAVLSLVQTVMRHDQIDLKLEIPDNLPDINCRSQQIQQVLMNLITNARHALNERYPAYSPHKKLRVSAKLIEKHHRKYIRATVEDSGSGISAEIQDRIFDPFFTTKPKGNGTGLGLSISYAIVRDHGGQLSVESEPGRFTRFHIDLPENNEWSLPEK